MSRNEEINKRLEAMKKNNESGTNPAGRVIDGITRQEEEKTDFEKIAQELEERKRKESVGLNDDYVKDTIYIQKDLYKAFNALCIKRGDKKHHVNRAISEYVQKEYKRTQKNK